MADARFGTHDQPDGEGHDGYRHHAGHEPGGDLIGDGLDRRAAALGLGDHGDDTRQQGVAPDRVGTHDQGAGTVDRAARDGIALRFLDRDGLPSEHGLVDRGATLQHDAIDGNGVSGANAQTVAHHDLLQRNLGLAIPLTDPASGLGRQVHQRADRLTRGGAGAQFE